MAIIITRERLLGYGACDSPTLRAFAAEWPDGAELTEANVRRAVMLRLPVDYARYFLPVPARKAYEEAVAPASKVYEEAVAPAWQAYEEALATASKAYQEALATAWQAYEEAKAPAWQAYKEAVAPARKAYEEAVASALLESLTQIDQSA